MHYKAGDRRVMNFLDIPNLPEKKVNLVLVDGRIGQDIEEKLMSLKINYIKTKPLDSLYPAISYHRIFFLPSEKNIIVYAPGVLKTF